MKNNGNTHRWRFSLRLRGGKRVVALLLGVLLCSAPLLLMLGPLSNEGDVAQHTNQGFDLLARGEYSKAMEMFERAISRFGQGQTHGQDESLNRDAARAYEGLAQAYACQGALADAARILMEASRIWPDDGRIQFYLGVIYSRLDAPRRKRGRGGRESATRSVRASQCYRRARLLGFNGDPESYAAALRLDPENPDLYYSLGLDYQDRKKYVNAAEEFEKALALSPNHPIYHCCLGITRLRQGRYEEAERSLKRALQLLPRFPDALGGLGEVYLRQKRYKQAKAKLFRAISLNPKDAYAHYLLGDMHAANGEDVKAIAEYRKAIRLSPDDYTYYYRLAKALTRQGKNAEAEKELETYRRLYAKYLESSTENAKRSAEGASAASRTTALAPRQSSTLPRKPSGPSRSSTVEFVDAALDAGINFRHHNGARDTPTILETTGSGAAFCDYDGDGLLDAYIVTSCYLDAGEDYRQPRNALYRNAGDGRFVDVTAAAAVGDIGYGMGCVFVDYDNDGDDDLYVTNYGANALYRNDGDGSFSYVTQIAGVGDDRFGTSCAFADYDGDGDLDLYVVNYVEFGPDSVKFCLFDGVKAGCGPLNYRGQRDVFYRNNGDGTFTDVTADAGVMTSGSQGLGVVFWDYDNDNRPDIYVANDAVQNFLFHNRGDGSMEEVSLFTGVGFDEDGTADSGMGVDVGDYDNDGDLDLFVANFQDLSNTLYRNNGSDLFSDVTQTSGLAEPSMSYLTFGAQFFDYDNDGFLDIFAANGHIHDNVELYRKDATSKQRNQLFRNNGDGTFTDVSDAAGEGFQIQKISRAAAFGDYDNDGDTDILVANSNDTATLLRNDGGNKNNFLSIKLVGVKSNRDAIGARIRVVSGPLAQIREVKSGSSYLSHNDLRQLFGLAQRERIDYVEIRWPSGVLLKLYDVGINEMIVVREDKGFEAMGEREANSRL